MADRYWVGGTGTWNTTSTTNWRSVSGGTTAASVPTVNDNVIFDGNSGGTFTVTMTGALNCASITVATGGTVTFATGTTPTLNVRGSIYLENTNWNSTGTVTFSATTSASLNTNGVVMDCPIVFNGVGGNWTLNSDFAYGKTAIRAMTLTNGTINGNGFTVSSLFASTFTIQTNTNTLNNFVRSATGLTTLASGTLNLSGGSFAGAFTHTSGTLNVTNDPVITGTYTFTAGALNLNGQTTTALTTGAFTYTAGTLTLNSYTLNVNTWASTSTTARTFAFGTGNLTVRGSGASLFNMTGATNITTTGSKTVNITNETTTASTVAPGAVTEAQSLDFYFANGTAYTLTFLGTASHAARNVNFSGFSGTWAANSTGVVYGNLTLGGTLTESTSALTMGGTSGTKILTTNGLALKCPLTFNGAGSTFKLGDALTMGATVARALTVVNGILDLDGFSISLGFAGSTMSTNTNSVSIINAHGGIYLPFTITSGTCSIRGTIDNSSPAYFSTNFTLTAGTMTLASNVQIGFQFGFTAGTINLSTFALLLDYSYGASGATTRVINFGSGSYIEVRPATGGTCYTSATIGTFSYTGTSDIRITPNGATSIGVNTGAATEAQAMNFTFLGSGYTLGTTGSNFKNLTLDVYNDGVNLNVWNIGTVTIYGNYVDLGYTGFGDRYFVPSVSASTLTFAGASGTKTISPIAQFRQPIVFNGAASIWQFTSFTNTDLVTLTAGTLNLATNNLTFTCGRFNSSGSTARTIAFGTGGGNIYVTGTGATATVFDTSTITNLTLTGTALVNVVSASTGVTFTVAPGAIAEASNPWVFDFNGAYSLSYLATAGHTARNINFTNFTGTWGAISTCTVYGDITLNGSMTIATSANAMTWGGTSGTKTVISNGKLIPFPIILNAAGATWRIGDAVSLAAVTTAFTHTNGTLDLNANSFTVGTYATGAGTKTLLMNSGNLYVSGSGATAFNNANPTNYTVSSGSGYNFIAFTSSTAKTFVGGGTNYDCYIWNTGSGALTVSGNNTFAAFHIGYTNLITGSNSFKSLLNNGYGPSRVLTLTAGTTQTITVNGGWGVSGSSGDLTTINSATAGSLAFIARNYAYNDPNYAGHMDYVSLKDIQFLPSNTLGTGTLPNIWWAGTNSTNLGNNFGVTFTDWNGSAATSIKAYYISSTSTTSWTVPNDWNSSNNIIHLIGGGGGGAGMRSYPLEGGGCGGGGGGYTQITNYSAVAGSSVSVAVGAGGTGGTYVQFSTQVAAGPGTAGGATTFGAYSAGGGAGGQFATTGTTNAGGGLGGTGSTYNGGRGGTVYADAGSGLVNGGGGGGGGAAGPYGAGGQGGNRLTSSGTPGTGGGGNGGGYAGTSTGYGGNGWLNTGGGTPGVTNGVAATAGALGTGAGSGGQGAFRVGLRGASGFDILGFIGSGGGGGSTQGGTGGSPSGAGGFYGGGGGGGGYNGGSPPATSVGGAGAQGVIVIQYYPISTGTPSGSGSKFFALF